VVFVFLVSDRRELQGLIECREWLRDSRLILVLPDEEMETVSRGHVLRPRFITYAESDFIDVSAVLGKMTGIGAVKYPSLSPVKGQDTSEERRII
jgi:hypothetical protein